MNCEKQSEREIWNFINSPIKYTKKLHFQINFKDLTLTDPDTNSLICVSECSYSLFNKYNTYYGKYSSNMN